jgi:hypothetical protein
MASSSAPPSGVWSRGGKASGAAVRGLGGLRRVGLGILTLATLLSLPAAAPAQIPVELRFDG